MPLCREFFPFLARKRARGMVEGDFFSTLLTLGERAASLSMTGHGPVCPWVDNRRPGKVHSANRRQSCGQIGLIAPYSPVRREVCQRMTWLCSPT